MQAATELPGNSSHGLIAKLIAAQAQYDSQNFSVCLNIMHAFYNQVRAFAHNGHMDRAHATAREEGWSREPIVEVLIPSTVDDSLAPRGAHVASLFCQHFRYALAGGREWDRERENAADAVIDLVNRHAPNFRASIVGRSILSPLDLERKFALIGGDIFHGKLSLNQLFSARPVLGHGNYRLPMAGLYLCGAGAHPGGGVTGVPGHNAAREVIQDWRQTRKKSPVRKRVR